MAQGAFFHRANVYFLGAIAGAEPWNTLVTLVDVLQTSSDAVLPSGSISDPAVLMTTLTSSTNCCASVPSALK